MKRSGVRSVREEDRHHRQVLVTVEIRLTLFHRVANLTVQLLVHVSEVQ